MLRPPPRATHTDPLFPYPTLFRSADFWQVTGDALDFALEASFGPGAAPAGLRPALMDSYLALDAYPEVQGVLETLKAAGMRTAVLSNGSPAMLEAVCAASGIAPPLDAVASSEERRVGNESVSTCRSRWSPDH